MTFADFDKGRILGKDITGMSRQELCEFISKLCSRIVAEVGTRGRRGGIYPENISIDDSGNIGIGPSGVSPWAGEELKYVAPELYWNGKVGASADVYSVGLLLYYGITGGKLPCEGECDDAQLRRMSGDDLKAPKNAGVRLGEIIEKALKFKPENRFQTLEEMRVVLDSCIKNLYLCGVPSAEAIFKKSDDELSDVERMMVGIIEKREEEEAKPPVEEVEEVKVYTPAPPKNESKTSAPAEKKTPELRPVAPARKNTVRQTDTMREKKIEEEIKKRRRRPLAVILVLCAMLVVVAIVFNAILRDFQQAQRLPDNMNAVDAPVGTPDPFVGEQDTATVIDSNSSFVDGNNSSIVIGEDPAQPGETAAPAETPMVTEHRYEIFVEDVSWTEARDKCVEHGGHLVVIGSKEEFDTVVAMADTAGVDKVWIGCHRVEGNLVWENDETPYYSWAKGEPSYTDQGINEDYLMLWNNRGWAYNDNRNDPVKDFPDWYSGTIAYVCEYGK